MAEQELDKKTVERIFEIQKEIAEIYHNTSLCSIRVDCIQFAHCTDVEHIALMFNVEVHTRIDRRKTYQKRAECIINGVHIIAVD